MVFSLSADEMFGEGCFVFCDVSFSGTIFLNDCSMDLACDSLLSFHSCVLYCRRLSIFSVSGLVLLAHVLRLRIAKPFYCFAVR